MKPSNHLAGVDNIVGSGGPLRSIPSKLPERSIGKRQVNRSLKQKRQNTCNSIRFKEDDIIRGYKFVGQALLCIILKK